MKKAFAIILMLCLLPCFAFADEAEEIAAAFESASFDELMQLNNIVQQYLFKKAVLSDPNGVLVPPGDGYTVGIDIPIGTYRILFSGLTDFDSVIIDVDFHDGNYSHMYMLGYGSASEIGKIELSEGATLTIIGGSVRFFPYTGLFH